MNGNKYIIEYTSSYGVFPCSFATEEKARAFMAENTGWRYSVKESSPGTTVWLAD